MLIGPTLLVKKFIKVLRIGKLRKKRIQLRKEKNLTIQTMEFEILKILCS